MKVNRNCLYCQTTPFISLFLQDHTKIKKRATGHKTGSLFSTLLVEPYQVATVVQLVVQK